MAKGDYIITTAKAHLLGASVLIAAAVRELRAAQRSLRRHPRCRAKETLPYYMLDSIKGALDECSTMPDWLREDAETPERNLARQIAEERRDLLYFARKADREARQADRERHRRLRLAEKAKTAAVSA